MKPKKSTPETNAKMNFALSTFLLIIISILIQL